jgi:hypothetical protein
MVSHQENITQLQIYRTIENKAHISIVITEFMHKQVMCSFPIARCPTSKSLLMFKNIRVLQ